MKLYKYITILSFFVTAGCSGDEDTVSPKNQSVEQTKDARPLQADSSAKQKESKGVFDHYKESIDSAKAVKQLVEDSEKKKAEAKEGI